MPAERGAASGPRNDASLAANVGDALRTRALANLRQATWEATQYLSPFEVEQYVEGVLDEVERDEP